MFKNIFKPFLIILLTIYGFNFLATKIKEQSATRFKALDKKLDNIIVNENLKLYKQKCKELGNEHKNSTFFDHMYVPDIDNYVFVCVLKNKRIAYYSDFKHKKFIDSLESIKKYN